MKEKAQIVAENIVYLSQFCYYIWPRSMLWSWYYRNESMSYKIRHPWEFFNVSFPSRLLFMIWIQKRLGLGQIGTISKHAEAHIQAHTSMHEQKLDPHQPSSTSLIFPLSWIKKHTQEGLFTLPALFHISHYLLCILTHLTCFWPPVHLWGMCLLTNEGASVLM